MKCVLLLGFFCEAVFFGESTSITDPNHEWKSEEVTKVMTLLMNYGNDKLQEKNNQSITAGGNPSAAIKQYLVAAVLSETEMNDSKNWNNLPEAITKDSARIEVIFNDKNYQNFPYKTKLPLHGEVLMLLERHDLPKMMERLREETNSSARPFVVLYSHYIPCSDVKKVEYHCAEELANAAIVNHDKYIMLVGFKMNFHLTNTNKSMKFMSMGGIKQFKLFENKTFVPLESKNKDPNKTQQFFQSLFYKCLNISQASDECCTVDNSTTDQQKTKNQILSMYINNIMHHCTTTKLKDFVGKLTELSRWVLVKCVSEFADEYTGNDCPPCHVPKTIYSIKVCAMYAATFGTELGRPKNPNDPYSIEMKEGPPKWIRLYKGYYENAVNNLPAVFCLKTTNDIKSLCTKMNLPRKEVPGSMRSYILKLFADLTKKLKDYL